MNLFKSFLILIVMFILSGCFMSSDDGPTTEDITLSFDEPELFPTEGMTINNQYEDYAVFSSDNGDVVMFNSNISYVHSGNALWSNGNLTVTFTSTAKNLQFYVIAMDAGTDTKAADINIYKGTTLDSTYELMGSGTPTVPFLVDLSSYGTIDKIDLVVTDISGLTYDTFTFTINN